MIYLEKIGIPDDTEIIIVDDGSEPPLEYHGNLPVRIHATNDNRPWTWALARNAGARLANGEYLFMFDIDHIITKECIDLARTFNGQKIHFKREFGVLTEDGELTQDLDMLVKYGFPKDRKLKVSPLPNNFVMRKDIFWALGGYREDLFTRPYPQGEDRLFKKAWCQWKADGKGTECLTCPTMYMFPNGYFCGDVDFNPFGLFHKLSRATKRNPKCKLLSV
jgi:glycosyltransferase involved in cell wall biosynthesis